MHWLSFGSRRILAGWSLQYAHVLQARERATERRYASRRDAGRLDVDAAMGSYQVRTQAKSAAGLVLCLPVQARDLNSPTARRCSTLPFLRTRAAPPWTGSGALLDGRWHH
jgi:hypothetical protein